MGPGLLQGHLGYRKRRSAPQLGQSAGGLFQESSLHSNARVWPGCWGSGLPLTQCCQNNPGDEMRSNEKDKHGKYKITRERRRKDRRRSDTLSSLRLSATELSAMIYSLKPVAASNYSGY